MVCPPNRSPGTQGERKNQNYLLEPRLKMERKGSHTVISGRLASVVSEGTLLKVGSKRHQQKATTGVGGLMSTRVSHESAWVQRWWSCCCKTNLKKAMVMLKTRKEEVWVCLLLGNPKYTTVVFHLASLFPTTQNGLASKRETPTLGPPVERLEGYPFFCSLF